MIGDIEGVSDFRIEKIGNRINDSVSGDAGCYFLAEKSQVGVFDNGVIEIGILFFLIGAIGSYFYGRLIKTDLGVTDVFFLFVFTSLDCLFKLILKKSSLGSLAL